MYLILKTINPSLYHSTVKNRLPERTEFWESIGYLKNSMEGYALPFVKQPPKMQFENNKSALSSADFVTNEIKDLLESGCIKEMKPTSSIL